MLPPDSRTTLLKRLEPPAGYAVTQVVGTTFTLDLDSALLPSLALSRSAAADSADRLETIAAVRASIGKIDIFHQCGLISVPSNRSRLHTLLEPALHAVRHKPGYLFHPKIWLARYEHPDDGYVVLRLLVLSRNLTRSRSWDVAITLEGKLASSPDARNKPIVDLLRYLPTTVVPSLSPSRTDRLTALAEEVRYAQWDLPAGANDIAFHVFGVPKSKTPQIDFSGYKHLVVSPFLTADGLERVALEAKGPLTVVSRQDSFDSLPAETSEWIDSPYVLSPTAGIPSEDDETTSGQVRTGLHAKLYCLERARLAHLFIGSANATRKAFNGNVEILVELTGSAKALGVDAFLGKDGFMSILQSTTIEPGGEVRDEPQLALDGHVRHISTLPLRSELSESDGAYRLHLTSQDAIPAKDGVTMHVSLLTDKTTSTQVAAGMPVDITFDGLELADVTAFVVITARDEAGKTSSAVVKCELIKDLSERMDAIVTREIDSPDAFRRFLSLLLAFGAPSGEVTDGEGGGPEGGTGKWDMLENGLFEQLLRAASVSPQTLEHLAGVVNSIIGAGDPHSVLPEGFDDLWAAISVATDLKVATNV